MQPRRSRPIADNEKTSLSRRLIKIIRKCHADQCG